MSKRNFERIIESEKFSAYSNVVNITTATSVKQNNTIIFNNINDSSTTQILASTNVSSSIPQTYVCSNFNSISNSTNNVLTNMSVPNNSNHVIPDNLSLEEKLKNIIIKYHVSHNFVNELLEILRCEGLKLPKDVRTLLRTPKNHEILVMDPGTYIHLGIEFMLKPILLDAIRILLSKETCLTLNGQAKCLLIQFVTEYSDLYGVEFISYNVHGLIHLPDFVLVHGPLDQFSAFKHPLSDIYNRIIEQNKQLKPINNYPVLKKEMEYNPLICKDPTITLYEQIITECFIVIIKYNNVTPMYNNPIKSDMIGCFYVETHNITSPFQVSEIKSVAITLLHKNH
ncbi:hypothetical protein ACI65C_004331 [Semiaphis heraclei]